MNCKTKFKQWTGINNNLKIERERRYERWNETIQIFELMD